MALELRRKASLKWKSNTFTLLMYLVMEHKKDIAFSKFLLVWQMDDDRPSRPLQEVTIGPYHANQFGSVLRKRVSTEMQH